MRVVQIIDWHLRVASTDSAVKARRQRSRRRRKTDTDREWEMGNYCLACNQIRIPAEYCQVLFGQK